MRLPLHYIGSSHKRFLSTRNQPHRWLLELRADGHVYVEDTKVSDVEVLQGSTLVIMTELQSTLMVQRSRDARQGSSGGSGNPGDLEHWGLAEQDVVAGKGQQVQFSDGRIHEVGPIDRSQVLQMDLSQIQANHCAVRLAFRRGETAQELSSRSGRFRPPTQPCGCTTTNKPPQCGCRKTQ